ncbi:hypothetical protein [Treponema socranskii]
MNIDILLPIKFLKRDNQWKFGLQKLTEFAKEIGAKIEFVK